MKKNIFVVIISILFSLFFYSLPASANPNGKGLICKCIKCVLENDLLYKSYELDMKELIIYFDNGAANAWTFKRVNDEILRGGLMPVEYQSNMSKIKWLWFELDRETLILKNVYPNSNIRKCTLFPNKEKFDIATYDLFLKYQNKLNKKIKKNQISY